MISATHTVEAAVITLHGSLATKNRTENITPRRKQDVQALNIQREKMKRKKKYIHVGRKCVYIRD